MPTSSRGLYRRPPQPQQRGGTRAKWVQPPDPAGGACFYDTMIGLAPVAYWRLGESAGTNANDEIGTLDGTYINTPTLGVASLLSGDSNTAVSFDRASSEYVDVPDNAVIDVGGADMSYVCLFETTSANRQTFIGKGTGMPMIDMGRLTSGFIEINVKGSGVSADAGSTAYNDGVSHLLVMTMKADGTTKLYIDGSDVTGVSFLNTTTNNATNLNIGRDTGVGNAMDGTLDEVAVFNKLLTPTNVTALQAARSVACGSGPSNLSRTVDDALSLAGDTVARAATLIRSVADSSTIANAVARVATLLRAPADAITIDAVLAVAKTLPRTVADSIATTDTVARVLTLTRTVADSVAYGNTVARVATLLRSTADSIATSDAVVASRTFARSLADSLGISDAVTRTLTLSRTAADSITVGNVVAGVRALVRSAADSITFSDAVVATRTFARTAADSLSISESVNGIKVILRTAADAFATSDAVTRVLTLARTASDATTYGDTVARVTTALRSASDAISFGNVVDGFKVFLRTVADSLAVGNTVARVSTAARTTADSLTLANTVTRIATLLRSATDSVDLGNVVTRTATFVRSVADAIANSSVVQAIASTPAAGGFGFVGRIISARQGDLKGTAQDVDLDATSDDINANGASQ